MNGRVWVAERYAVDWEQLDAQNRIHVGPKLDYCNVRELTRQLSSFLFGRKVYSQVRFAKVWWQPASLAMI